MNYLKKKPHVLIACECSGIIREAFNRTGCDAWSCDYKESEIKGNHIKGDVLVVVNNGWDLLIAHPPCTRLTNSVWWYIVKNNLYHEVKEAAGFFMALHDAPIEYKGIENPIPNKEARRFIPKYNQIIQPYEFGDDASKATCLWLTKLPPLLKTGYYPPRWVKGRPRWSNQTDGGWNKLPPSKNRGALRSKTYPGIAKAMAEQWTPIIKI